MPDGQPTIGRSKPIAFIDLDAQRRRLDGRVEAAIQRVVSQGAFILGPEVAALERRLEAFTGAAACVTCASGTDALALALMVKDVGPGEAVLVPSFTFAATAEVVVRQGAVPVFLDVCPDTFTLTPDALDAGVAAARAHGLRPVGVIPVDLFGQPAPYATLGPAAAALGLWVLADAAQSLGATLDGRPVGVLADVTATSFFPSKPLGCYGDGGALLLADAALAGVVRSLRAHGQGAEKYDTVRIGVNSRLDTLQAAILLEKLAIFPDEIVARTAIAARYGRLLGETVPVPVLAAGITSTWAQYTIRCPAATRGQIAARLRAAGVPTGIYYPKPLHRQPAYRGFPVAGGAAPVADRLAGEVLSLPMHAYLDEETQDRIVDAVRAVVGP